MKTKTKLSLILSSIALGLGAFSALSVANAFEVKAYDTSTLPTTIDLNDTAEEDVRNYYSSLNNLSTSERQGTNLLKNLKPILKNKQKYYKYDKGGAAIWKMYEITDRDWAKSPASGTAYGTYNATTNKIVGYQYGSSASNSKNNPYIHALYVNRNVENLTTAWDDHDQTQWGINREHVWPKSQGFNTEGEGGARGDPFHLMAGNGRVNGTEHNNNLYGYVNLNYEYTDPVTAKHYNNLSGNYSGFSLTRGGNDTVFEPQDCDKGDIARAVFYMVARYNYLSGSDPDGINANNPNLEITNTTTALASYDSSTTKTGKMGVLTDLLAWHHADPVDAYEIHRNNLLFTNFTNNRNPFIDFPDWVDYIWGTATYNGRNYVSYDSAPTGYAQPGNDTLNAFGNATSDSLTLNKTKINLLVGDTGESLTATPSSPATVYWSTSNSDIVSISATTGSTITLTAEGAGNATITAYAVINGLEYFKSCSVSVTSEDGEDVGGDIVIAKGNYTPGYSDSGTSGTIYKSVNSENDLEIKYNGINTQSIKGYVYGYTMYIDDKGFIYSNNCPTGYYPTKIKVNYSSGTGENGHAGITFGKSVLSTRNTSVDGEVKKNGSIVLENDDYDNLFWNFSTKDSNVQVSTIEITYDIRVKQVTSVSLDKNTAILKVGGTLQLNAEVLPLDADDTSISFTSSDESVATVTDEGLVTGVYGGSVTISAYASNGIYDSCSVTVTFSETGFYKIDSGTKLENGKYLIVYEQDELAFNGNLASLDVISNKVSSPINNGFIDYSDDLLDATFTITSKNNGYSIKSNSNKYIGRTSDSNGLSTSNNDDYTNEINYDASGNLDITTSSTHLRYNATSGQERFRYYKSTTYTNQKAIALYRYYYCSDKFSEDFRNAITCDSTGATNPVLSKTWSEFETLYNAVYDKETLRDATFTVKGNVVTPTGSTTQVVANAMSLYDFLVEKYGFTAFIENRTNNLRILNQTVTKDNFMPVIFVVFGFTLVGVASILIRKRKEE